MNISSHTQKIRSAWHAAGLSGRVHAIGGMKSRFGAHAVAWKIGLTVLIFALLAGWAARGFLSERFAARTVVVAGPEELAFVQDAPLLELHIANNGLVYMQGARVVSISQTGMTVSSKWEAATFRWMIEIDDKTRFVEPDGETGMFSDIRLGDFVNITGYLISSSPPPSIRAEAVRRVLSPAGDTVVRLENLPQADSAE